MTFDAQAGILEREVATECHDCLYELLPGDTIHMHGAGDYELDLCASCAAERVGRDVAWILFHHGLTVDYRRMRRALEVWTEIGERLKRAVDAEGEKPACTVTQLPAPKEIAHG